MIDLRLPPGPEAPSSARHALDGLAGRVPSAVLDDLRLLVSELVTNSIRHGSLDPEQRVHLRVEIGPGVVRVQVSDPGKGFEALPAAPSLYQDHGWGLYLVGQIADRWGVDRALGTSVWFELDADRATRPA